MILQALLVSNDDRAADVLARVLSDYGIALDRSSNPDTSVARIEQQKFDALLLDFDDPAHATEVLQHARQLRSGSSPLTVALLAERNKVREIFTSGSHFVLYKPLSDDAARAGLRAMATLLNRERRRSLRVPIQAPVQLTLSDSRSVEGILLDLSETGMDVLTAEAQARESVLDLRFQLPQGFEVQARGRVAWANPNGQTGVHFIDVAKETSAELKRFVQAAASNPATGPCETVPHCKLTDLSLGGCYLETDAPFPERALVDLCLKAGEMEIHTDAMVRVAHPAHGMGLEFPSRTAEQRAQVANLISFLRNCPIAMLEVSISPRALVADLAQFENTDLPTEDDLDDPLLELLRKGCSMPEDDFLAELHHQRSPQDPTPA